MQPRDAKEREHKFNEEFQRIQKRIYVPYNPPKKPSFQASQETKKEYEEELKDSKKSYDLNEKQKRGYDFQVLFERCIKDKETNFIKKEHIEIFVSTFPALISRSYSRQETSLLNHVKQLLNIEEPVGETNLKRKRFHDLFILNPEIQKIMLSLPVDNHIASCYTNLFFPVESNKNQSALEETIDLKNFKDNIIENNNETIIKIDSNSKKLEDGGLSLKQLQALTLKYPNFFNSIKNLTIHIESGLPAEGILAETLSTLAKFSIHQITFITPTNISKLENIKKIVDENKITSQLRLKSLIEKKPDLDKKSSQRIIDHGDLRRIQAAEEARELAFETTLIEIQTIILRNRRELNKQKLKLLLNTEEKFHAIAKEIILELPEKLCSCLNFSAFNSPNIEAVLIDLLKKGHSKAELYNKLIDFIQVSKDEEEYKNHNFFNSDIFHSAYQAFDKHPQNNKIRQIQLYLLTNASAQRWNKMKETCEKALGLSHALEVKNSDEEITFINDLSTILLILKNDTPDLKQITEKDSKDLYNSIAMMLMTFIINGINDISLKAILNLDILNRINIDELINQCSTIIESLEEKLKNNNIVEFHELKKKIAILRNQADELSSQNTKKADELLESKKQLRSFTTPILGLENNIAEIENELSAIKDESLIAQKNLQIEKLKQELLIKKDEFRMIEPDLSLKIKNLTEELAVIEKSLPDSRSEADRAEIRYNKILEVIKVPVQAIENFPALKSALEVFKKEKIRRKNLTEHPYKITKTDKQDFQMQQQQQQQQQLNESYEEEVKKPTSTFIDDEENQEKLNKWLGRKENRIVKTMTKDAFDVLNNENNNSILDYGLALNNLPKGFYINNYDKANVFLDYDAKLQSQPDQNENVLTQQLPIEKKSAEIEDKKQVPVSFTVDNDDKMLQFENKHIPEAKQNYLFSAYVNEILLNEKSNNDKFFTLLKIENNEYKLQQPNPLSSITKNNLEGAAKLFYVYGNAGIEFLFNKINNIAHRNQNGFETSKLFIDKWLNQSTDWNEFTTLSTSTALDTLASLTANQMAWWNTLIQQHDKDKKIGTSFPELMNAFHYFIEKYKVLTKNDDLPETCGLDNVDNMLTGLNRYLEILYLDPTKTLKKLDIDTYNTTLKEIQSIEKKATPQKIKPTPIQEAPAIEEKKLLEMQQNMAAKKAQGRNDFRILEEQFNFSFAEDQFKPNNNVDDIISHIRHLNVSSPLTQKTDPSVNKCGIVEVDEKTVIEEYFNSHTSFTSLYIIQGQQLFYIDKTEKREINYAEYIPWYLDETKLTAEEKQNLTEAEKKEFIAATEANTKKLADFKKLLKVPNKNILSLNKKTLTKLYEFTGEEPDTTIIHDAQEASGVLEKMSLAEAYTRINSWGHETSKVIHNLARQYREDDEDEEDEKLNQYPLTEDMKLISITHVEPDCIRDFLEKKNINLPISLYELSEFLNQNTITNPNTAKPQTYFHYTAKIDIIPKAIKDMSDEEIKEYAQQCRTHIKEKTEQLRNLKEDKKKDENDSPEIKKQLIDTKLFYLALLREGMCRADANARFANSTQLLSVINETILNEGNSFAQIGTGQGKSLITALIAAMLSAEGTSVDIITSDPHLANEGIKEFSNFYKFFNIPCSDRAIESTDELDQYKKGGINYSDITSMAVFRSRMQLEYQAKVPDPVYFAGPVSAILDEADYIVEFPTTIRYVKGNEKDDILSKHPWIYKILNDFIDKPEYNHLEQIIDKKRYLIEEATKYICEKVDDHTIKNLLENEHIDILSSTQIDKWLAAAWNAKHIAEIGLNKTFKIATKTINGKNYSVVHHIINNKESEHAQLMNGGQQFLHARMQAKLDGVLAYPFALEAETHALTSVQSIDFIEYYAPSKSNPGGKIKGHTGFIGDPAQLDAIASKHNVQSTAYPTHQQKQRKDEQGIFLNEKQLDEEIFQQIAQMLKENRPILLLCKNAEEAKKMADKVQHLKNTRLKQSKANINLYTAIDKKQMLDGETDFTSYDEMSDNDAIIFANKNCSITISDASLGRGKDFKPEHKDGLHVILNYLGTQADIEQGIGRAGRQGAKGSSFHGVTLPELTNVSMDAKTLPLKTDHKNKKTSDINRQIIANKLHEARENTSKQLRKTSLFEEAFANISRYFHESYLQNKNAENAQKKYTLFRVNMESIWKETLEKNIDTYEITELKNCFSIALEKIWDKWPFDKSSYEDKRKELLEKIKLPIRQVKPPNFSIAPAPTMNPMNSSNIGFNLRLTEEKITKKDDKHLELTETKDIKKPEIQPTTTTTSTVNQNVPATQTSTPNSLPEKQELLKPKTFTYQPLKNSFWERITLTTPEIIPHNDVLSYAYANILKTHKNLDIHSSSVELTIKTEEKCLFEAYMLIAKALNININNKSKYLAFEPTDKQRAYLEHFLRQQSQQSVFKIDTTPPTHLITLKKLGNAYNSNAFKKKSTLPFSELDLLLIAIEHYKIKKLSDETIANLNDKECQQIINDLEKKRDKIESLSQKERCINARNHTHGNESRERGYYKEHVINDIIDPTLNQLKEALKNTQLQKKKPNITTQTEVSNTTPKTTTLQHAVNSQQSTGQHAVKTNSEQTTLHHASTFSINKNTYTENHFDHIENYKFNSPTSTINIERNVLDSTKPIKDSPTDMYIASTPEPSKPPKKIKNTIKTKENKEPLGIFIENYSNHSYQIINESILNKGYQSIKGNTLFSNIKIPTENTLMCAYSQLLAIEKAFEGKEPPIIEITTKDECLFQAYILIFECKPRDLFNSMKLQYENKTKFHFTPSKEQIHHTHHTFTFAEHHQKSKNYKTIFTSLFQSKSSQLTQQQLKTFIMDMNRIENDLSLLKENLNSKSFTQEQRKITADTLTSECKKLAELTTQLKTHTQDRDLAAQIQRHTKTADGLQAQIKETIGRLNMPSKSSPRMRHTSFH